MALRKTAGHGRPLPPLTSVHAEFLKLRGAQRFTLVGPRWNDLHNVWVQLPDTTALYAALDL